MQRRQEPSPRYHAEPGRRGGEKGEGRSVSSSGTYIVEGRSQGNIFVLRTCLFSMRVECEPCINRKGSAIRQGRSHLMPICMRKRLPPPPFFLLPLLVFLSSRVYLPNSSNDHRLVDRRGDRVPKADATRQTLDASRLARPYREHICASYTARRGRLLSIRLRRVY